MAPALQQGGSVVRVVPLLRLHHLGDRTFDYLVPQELAKEVGPGSIVRIPFGARSVRGIVIEALHAPPADTDTLRAIDGCLGDRLSPALVALAQQLSDRYLSPLEACLRLAMPPYGPGDGAVKKAKRPTWIARAADWPDLEGEARLTKKQQALLDAVPDGGASVADVCALAQVGRGVAETLMARGILVPMQEPAAAVVPLLERHALQLWPEQQAALDALTQALAEPGFQRRLLWGVTGSGKTEVYLRLIVRILATGGGAILLVPEIALTPQMIGRVRDRFGESVGVLHSGLAKGERLREYRRIAAGEARVVVGARSAVFAPLADLRAIIIDESHDSSYKQEESPRYHALTVAKMRLQLSDGLLVEGTATPSLESAQPEHEILRLTHRASGALPAVEVVDMRHQSSGELLSARAREALAETLRREEQAIVLLNRRGYAAHVHCDDCGHVMKCTDCELSLTYHSSSRRLLCHHCGRVFQQPNRCPACGGPPLTRGAPGTERLDAQLKELVPRDQVFRIDSDVASSGSRLQAILSEFEASRPAVLVGTQMVAKGHDFPNVTLVVVADADTGLYVPDFRAAERTFQLLTQVAGRAGRATSPGRVVVQTWNPDVACIRMALQRDEQGFYAQELRSRQTLGYPPFNEIIRLVTQAEDRERGSAAARHLTEQLAKHFSSQELRGPARLPTIRGKERWHVLVVSTDGRRARAIVGAALNQLVEPYRSRGVALLVDVDPLSFG